jgi:hypothetical protein
MEVMVAHSNINTIDFAAHSVYFDAKKKIKGKIRDDEMLVAVNRALITRFPQETKDRFSCVLCGESRSAEIDE